MLEDLQLVVSELVTNSVKFGPKRAITLALTIGRDGVVKGEVIDQGDGERAKVEMTAEPTLDGGWGLHLVDQVAMRWGVHEGSTHVWFEIGPHRRRAATALTTSGGTVPRRSRFSEAARQVRRSRSATSSALRSAFSWALDELVLRLALALFLAPFACAGWRRRRGRPPPS